ncbi:MAG: Flp pilus assembly complex ATPase component TadA [Anaerolineales bacterium]|nr:Flp pilus assembly complex ATPase component TadA [Anaerolineales bacterium]
MGFLNELLPPTRDNLSEITLNPDGTLWLMKKGARGFEELNVHPPLDEVWRSVEALLAPMGRARSEATPTVDAKQPRAKDGLSGARIKIIHPDLAPGGGYPSINIRLFEPKPVLPDQLIAWNIAPPGVIEGLVEAVSNKLRMLVVGGTATGKTTLLSALANGIPQHAQVVKIEDHEEIWLPHPNVVTLKARPAPPGSTIPPYRVQDGVDDAMRMAPDWLIVGEVRTSQAALSLFRAQMSDHPGLSTFYADGAEAAVHRIAVIMEANVQVPGRASREIIAQAVGLVVQVGWEDGKRKIVGVWETEPEMKARNVLFKQVYKAGEMEMNRVGRKRL